MAQPPSKVLIIEDEEPIRRFIRRVLESSCEVHEAGDGAEGLKQARWVQPAVILLDLRMPGLDGLTVLAKLKAEPRTAAIPVIIVSGRGETDLLIEGQKMGAVDHVIKPFDVEDLRNVVRRQLVLRNVPPEQKPQEGDPL